MPITQIPFQDPVAPPSDKSQPEQLELYQQQDWEAAYRDLDARVPHLLIQLQDDLQRSRRREAAWLSVIVHLVVFIFLWNFKLIEKYIPFHTVVVVPQNFAKDHGITVLTLPPDEQKLTHKQRTNVISDKDRQAMTKHPELDPKELRKILASPPPGLPGLRGPQGTQPSPPQAMMQNPPSIQPQQSAPAQQRPQFETNQSAQLQAPQQKNSFSKYTQGMSAGSAIQQAAQAAASRRGGGQGGQEGDLGLGTGAHGRQYGSLEVLSDTMGVDFSSYLERMRISIYKHWYEVLPESVLPPTYKKGKLMIEFAILDDGSVAGMKLIAPSGDSALDRAAWGGITGSNPFPPLPTEFVKNGGHVLALRCTFIYNPDERDLQ
jgi:TonB family protein